MIGYPPFALLGRFNDKRDPHPPKRSFLQPKNTRPIPILPKAAAHCCEGINWMCILEYMKYTCIRVSNNI